MNPPDYQPDEETPENWPEDEPDDGTERERTIREVREALARLKELQDEHGEAGVLAFMLGWPVEDVLRVSGGSVKDASEDQER